VPVKKPRFSPLQAWSYSTYTQYLKCALSVCFDKIQRIRIQEPENPHLVKGNRTHTLANTFVGATGPKAKLPKLAEGLEKFKPRLEALRKAAARIEIEWAFTRDWSPTGWFDKDAWLRVKLDACRDSTKPPEVEVVDYKTGKLYPDHKQQRSLYALAGLRLVQIGQLAGGSKDVALTATHLYTDTGFVAEESFGMKNLVPLKREWTTRTKEMLADTEFRAKTGPHCRWCKFAKSKGGPCPENQ
jgi:RecB family exonuclease